MATGIALIFAALRAIEDGPNGEVITALTLVAACVLFVGGAIVGVLDKRKPPS
jgi:hypothetical protein